jgi:hypothetical protein
MTRFFLDGSASPPRLRLDLNLMTLMELPDWTAAPKGSDDTVAARLRAEGFEGVQTADVARWRATGLRASSSGVVRVAAEAAPLIRAHKEAGADATTLHVGTGMESHFEARLVVEAVLGAARRFDHPVFVETHRGTLFQDIWRTLKLIEWFPELRFNADLSHWYTGLSMTYGDFAGKLDRMQPLFERVGYLHGRIGNQCCVQVPIGVGGRDEPHLSHFRLMWTRCFAGFLRHARPGDVVIFAPELLANVWTTPDGPIFMDYAQLERDESGAFVERSDRWEQALRLCAIARDCFAQAASSTAAAA